MARPPGAAKTPWAGAAETRTAGRGLKAFPKHRRCRRFGKALPKQKESVSPKLESFCPKDSGSIWVSWEICDVQ